MIFLPDNLFQVDARSGYNTGSLLEPGPDPPWFCPDPTHLLPYDDHKGSVYDHGVEVSILNWISTYHFWIVTAH